MLAIKTRNSPNFQFPPIKLRTWIFNALVMIIAFISIHHICYNLIGVNATTAINLHIHRSLRGIITNQIYSRSLAEKLKSLLNTVSNTKSKALNNNNKVFKEKEMINWKANFPCWNRNYPTRMIVIQLMHLKSI